MQQQDLVFFCIVRTELGQKPNVSLKNSANFFVFISLSSSDGFIIDNVITYLVIRLFNHE